MNTRGRIFLAALWIGLLLFPFSTSPESFIVIHYGHPFLAVAGIMGFALRLRDSRRLTFLEGLACSWVVAMVLTSFWAARVIPSLARAGTHIAGLGVFLGIQSIAISTDRGRTILRSVRENLVLSGVILACYYLVNLALSVQTYGLSRVLLERYVGGAASLPWGATNTIGACLMIPLVSLFAVKEKPMRLQWPASVLLILAILSTFSRTLLILLVLLFIGILFLEKRMALLKAFGAVLVLLVPISHYLVGQDAKALSTLMASRTDIGELSTLNDRTHVWQLIWSRVSSNPFIGVGYYGSLDAFGYSGHNILLTTLAEGGLMGLLPMLAFLVGLFIYVSCAGGRRMARIPLFRLNRGALCFGILMLNLLVEDAHYTYVYITYFWVIIALLISSIRSKGNSYDYYA